MTIPAGYHNGGGKVIGPTLATLVGTNVNLENGGGLLSGYTAYGKNGTKYTGSHVCKTLAQLVGANVTLASAGGLLKDVTAYGKNGTKYTGTHVCKTLAQLVGTNVNLENGGGLLSGYTAYGKNGVKHSGTIVNMSNSIDYATTDASVQSKSCYRINGNYIDVVPRYCTYWGNWNWEKSCIKIPRSSALEVKVGKFTFWDSAHITVGFRPSMVVYYDTFGSEAWSLGLLTYVGETRVAFVNTSGTANIEGSYITDTGFYLPNEITYTEGREGTYIALKI